MFIAPWWGAKAAWGKALWAAGSINSVLVTFDEGFAHDWGKVGKRVPPRWAGESMDACWACMFATSFIYARVFA